MCADYPELGAAADAAAQNWIDESLKTSQGAPLLQGMAKELQAHLAFRKGAREQATGLAAKPRPSISTSVFSPAWRTSNGYRD